MTIDPLKMHPPMLRPGPRGPGAFEQSFFLASLLVGATAIITGHDMSNALAHSWTRWDWYYYPILAGWGVVGLVASRLRTRDCSRRVRQQLSITGGALVALAAQWAIYAAVAFAAGWGGFQGGFLGGAMTLASAWRLIQIVRDLRAMDVVVGERES